MSSRPLLEGEVTQEIVDPAIDALHEQLEKYAQILRMLQTNIELLQKRLDRIESGLWLAAGDAEAGVMPPHVQRSNAVWEEWKQRLGGGVLARFIDAFLAHGELDSNQLAIITKCGRSNVATYIHRLNKVSLINKNGNRFSLKPL